MVYMDNRLYEGEFHLDQKTGKGYELLPNEAFYKGTFLNGKPHGKGTYQWPNGEIYDGEWV